LREANPRLTQVTSARCNSRWSSIVPEGVTAFERISTIAIPKESLHCSYGFNNNGTRWRELDQSLIAEEEHNRHEHIEDARSKESKPEADVVLSQSKEVTV
jgi:hypothetical protein